MRPSNYRILWMEWRTQYCYSGALPCFDQDHLTMSTAQGRALMASVRATEPRAPPQGAVGVGLRPSRLATPTASQGSQTEESSSYATMASRRQQPTAPPSGEAPPSYAETRTADLAHAQQELMASMANLTAVANPYRQQVFAPPTTTAPLRGTG